MKISDIYTKFNIPPNLQLHMLRVASFASILINNLRDKSGIDSDAIVNSCLLHDLGNIIKFDFDNFPELLGEEMKNIEYWKKIKELMIQKYGNDEDKATVEMVKEIGIDGEELFIIENWGFKKFTRIAESDNYNWKIAVYSDHRISPSGVVSLRENLENKRKRYKFNRAGASHLSDEAEELFKSALKVEREIQGRVLIDVGSIGIGEIDKEVQVLKIMEI